MMALTRRWLSRDDIAIDIGTTTATATDFAAGSSRIFPPTRAVLNLFRGIRTIPTARNTIDIYGRYVFVRAGIGSVRV